VAASDVRSLSLALLRGESEGALASFMEGLSGGVFVTVNAETYDDLRRFSEAVRTAVRGGRRFALQSAASVVKTLARVPDKPLLDSGALGSGRPGVVIVGSHVQKTTRQLRRLLEHPATKGVEVAVDDALRDFDSLLAKTVDSVAAVRAEGRTPVVYTSREELRFASKEERLAAGRTLSRFLWRVVRDLPGDVGFMIAKGGITSHDILTHGLEVERARVLGQILPGVPVIVTPETGRFRKMPYVIFPGNVGDDGALLKAFEILSGQELHHSSRPTAPVEDPLPSVCQ
jgi:uncharacterized protein YgbK (DUF1537 family)